MVKVNKLLHRIWLQVKRTTGKSERFEGGNGVLIARNWQVMFIQLLRRKIVVAYKRLNYEMSIEKRRNAHSYPIIRSPHPSKNSQSNFSTWAHRFATLLTQMNLIAQKITACKIALQTFIFPSSILTTKENIHFQLNQMRLHHFNRRTFEIGAFLSFLFFCQQIYFT